MTEQERQRRVLELEWLIPKEDDPATRLKMREELERLQKPGTPADDA